MKRVLLVDDDDDLREALCALLAFDGYEVAAVTGGHEALVWLEANGRPDLILLDLMMPEMSGAELKAALDGTSHLRTVPVVVLSGDTHVAEQAMRMGAAGWICKPAPMEALLRAIAAYA